MKERTVTVSGGAYATVRAIKEARRQYGPAFTVDGIIGPNWGRFYTYRVVSRETRRV